MKEILKWILFVLYGQSSKFLNRGWMTLALEQFRVLPSICCGGWLPVAWWKCQQVAPPNRCSLRQFPFSFADPGWSGIWPRCVWFSRIVEFGVLHDPYRTLVIAEKGRWVALPYAECLEESTDPHSLLRWLAHGTIFGISSGQGDAGLSSAAPSYSRAVEREDIPSCGTPGVDITSVVSIGKTSEHVGIGTRTREAKTMITGRPWSRVVLRYLRIRLSAFQWALPGFSQNRATALTAWPMSSRRCIDATAGQWTKWDFEHVGNIARCGRWHSAKKMRLWVNRNTNSMTVSHAELCLSMKEGNER